MKTRSRSEHSIRSHLAVLETGAVWKSPVPGPSVEQLTFSDKMNRIDLKKFLGSKGVLGSNGILSEGMMLLNGVIRLSSIDQVCVLAPIMGVLEECGATSDVPYPFRVRSSDKRKYQDAVAFNWWAGGEFVPPSHNHLLIRKQLCEGCANTGEMHALFLNNDPSLMLVAFIEMVRASVVHAHGNVLGAVEMWASSTIEKLAFQHEQSKKYVPRLNAAGQRRNENRRSQLLEEVQQTLFGALRQDAFCFQLGYGMEPDRQANVLEIERDASLTFKGCHGGVREVAIVAALTGTKYANRYENKSAYEKWLKRTGAKISSPAFILPGICMLFEAGIASHKTGDCVDISLSGDQRKLNSSTGAMMHFLSLAHSIGRQALLRFSCHARCSLKTKTSIFLERKNTYTFK